MSFSKEVEQEFERWMKRYAYKHGRAGLGRQPIFLSPEGKETFRKAFCDYKKEQWQTAYEQTKKGLKPMR